MSKDLKAIATATKEVEQSVTDVQQKVEELSKYVPNAHEWIKKYSIKELGKVYESIEYKLGTLKGKPLEEQLNILTHVVDEVLVKEEFGAQKYKQLEVFKQAYKQQLDIVQYKVDKQSTENILIKSKDFLDATKSKVVKKLGEELKELLDKDAPSLELKSKANALTKAIEKQEAISQQRAMAKQALSKSESNPIEFSEFSKKEQTDMLNTYRTNRVSTMDKALRPITEAVWETLSDEERIVLTKYTQTYCYLNEPLRGLTYKGERPRSEYERDLPILTSALNKFRTEKPMVVRRGTDSYFIRELGKNLTDVREGDVFTDGGFLSTACHRNKGFDKKQVNMVILVPKGARGAFAEPFSHYTDNLKFDFEKEILWDGRSKEKINREFEWIGQRGSKFKVISVEKDTVYLQLIGQLQ